MNCYELKRIAFVQTRAIAVIALVLISATVAVADGLPLFEALTTYGPDNKGSSPVVSSGLHSDIITDSSGSTIGSPLAQATAAAGGGMLSTFSRSTAIISGEDQTLSSYDLSTLGEAAFNLPDLMITGSGSSVVGSANFDLSGTFATNATISGAGNSDAVMGLAIVGSLAGNSFQGVYSQNKVAFGDGSSDVHLSHSA
jgi:hypothetical protein